MDKHTTESTSRQHAASMKISCHELTLLLLRSSALHSGRAHCTVDAWTLYARMDHVIRCQEDLLVRVVVWRWSMTTSSISSRRQRSSLVSVLPFVDCDHINAIIWNCSNRRARAATEPPLAPDLPIGPSQKGYQSVNTCLHGREGKCHNVVIFTMRNTVKTLPMTTVQIEIAVNAPPEVMETDA